MHQLVQEVDHEVFVDFGFPIGASVNGYRFVNPKNHLYSEEAIIKDCGVQECQNKPCYCTHFLGESLHLPSAIELMYLLTVCYCRFTIQQDNTNGAVKLCGSQSVP